MEYAAHNVPSYQHLMGSEKPAHLGSQSMSPTSAKSKNEGLKKPMGKSSDSKAHKVP